MRHFKENFDDNCYELQVLRWFRDNFVSERNKEYYYEMAPIIVENIEKIDGNNKIYKYIYENVIDASVKAIEKGDYESAYNRYKSSVVALAEQFGTRKNNNAFVKKKV